MSKKRDAQLADDWKTIANTAEGRRVIADLMVWGNVYNPIDEDNSVKLALAVGENNFAKRVAYYLGYQPGEMPKHAEDDLELLFRMQSHSH